MGGRLMVVVGADEGAVERRLPPPNPTMPPSGEHRENRTPNTLLEWCTKNILIVNYSKNIFPLPKIPPSIRVQIYLYYVLSITVCHTIKVL
jgi:hypothetical protein